MGLPPPVGHIAEGDARVLLGLLLLGHLPVRAGVQIREKGIRPLPRPADFGDVGRVAPVQQGRLDALPPMTKEFAGAAARRASSDRNTSAPSGAKEGSRDRIRFRRFFRGRPPGKVARVLRPRITGWPVVRA